MLALYVSLAILVIRDRPELAALWAQPRPCAVVGILIPFGTINAELSIMALEARAHMSVYECACS